jgi:hypothetical protein
MPDPEPRLNFLRAYGALVPALLVGSIVGIAIQDADRVLYITAGVFALLLAALHFLPARAARPLADGFEGLGEFAFGGFLFLLFQVPGIGAYVFSRYVIETFPPGVQLAIMLLWLLALGAASLLMYSRPLWRKFRQRVEDWLNVRFRVDSESGRLPVWVAVALYIDFVLIAMGGFAAFASILHASGPPLFLPGARAEVSHGVLADLFLWHLLDAIPGLKVNETIRWAAPLTYERAAAGWLVLLFKVVVIVPVVSGIGRYLKDEDEKTVAQQGEAEAARPRGSVGPSE